MRNMARSIILAAGLVLAALPAAAGVAGGGRGDGHEGAMHLHHMHTLMNHALIMVLQGVNLQLLSQVQPQSPVAGTSRLHGREMVAEGKGTLKAVLSGPEMQAAHQKGSWSDPLMGYTHELGAELLAVVDDLEKLEPREGAGYQRQVALNHALEMAAEGSNLVMLGGMKMAGAVDDRTVSHGRKMIADARSLWGELAAPEATGAAGRFSKHGGKVLALLEKMSALYH